MPCTLARHCKVSVDKTSRCRGRVFIFTQHWYELYELWQFYYILVHTESQLLYKDNSYKLLVHSSDIICPVLGKCRLSKVSVDKTSRCRGRVFLYLHNTGMSCMSYGIFIIS